MYGCDQGQLFGLRDLGPSWDQLACLPPPPLGATSLLNWSPGIRGEEGIRHYGTVGEGGGGSIPRGGGGILQLFDYSASISIALRPISRRLTKAFPRFLLPLPSTKPVIVRGSLVSQQQLLCLHPPAHRNRMRTRRDQLALVGRPATALCCSSCRRYHVTPRQVPAPARCSPGWPTGSRSIDSART